MITSTDTKKHLTNSNIFSQWKQTENRGHLLNLIQGISVKSVANTILNIKKEMFSHYDEEPDKHIYSPTSGHST